MSQINVKGALFKYIAPMNLSKPPLKTSSIAPFFMAPHRPFFLLGAIQGVLSIAVWLGILEGQMQTSLPGGALHGWLMLYGFLPYFVLGFLFTALPNWVSGSPVGRTAYLGAAGLMGLGGGVFYLGLSSPGWILLGLALHVVGWAWAVIALGQVLRQAKPQDKRQPWLTWWATLMGVVGNGLFLIGSGSDSASLLAASLSVGVWLFLTPLFLGICHRMVPWFTSRVLSNYVIVRPYTPLWIMLTACLAHAALEIAGLPQWTWVADLPLAVLTLWFISRWGIARSFHVRLLAMLHIAFVWAAVGFLLYGVSSLAQWLEWPWHAGNAPLHALGMGFFGAMLIGMASRVSLGHSGRKLECDAATWGLFWWVQVAALLRMAPDMLPLPSAWITIAGLLWLAVFGVWAIRYAPMTWRPRVDGKPG